MKSMPAFFTIVFCAFGLVSFAQVEQDLKRCQLRYTAGRNYNEIMPNVGGNFWLQEVKASQQLMQSFTVGFERGIPKRSGLLYQIGISHHSQKLGYIYHQGPYSNRTVAQHAFALRASIQAYTPIWRFETSCLGVRGGFKLDQSMVGISNPKTGDSNAEVHWLDLTDAGFPTLTFNAVPYFELDLDNGNALILEAQINYFPTKHFGLSNSQEIFNTIDLGMAYSF